MIHSISISVSKLLSLYSLQKAKTERKREVSQPITNYYDSRFEHCSDLPRWNPCFAKLEFEINFQRRKYCLFVAQFISITVLFAFCFLVIEDWFKFYCLEIMGFLDFCPNRNRNDISIRLNRNTNSNNKFVFAFSLDSIDLKRTECAVGFQLDEKL